MIISTLCYLENNDQYLMLLRNKKKHDVNEGKWIGVGGKTQAGESPEECVCREVYEETGLILDHYTMRGVFTFLSIGWEEECIFVFTADQFHGQIKECDEGQLCWIKKDSLMNLNLWEGDKIFLKILLEDNCFFSLKLSYNKDQLVDCIIKTY